MKRFAVLASGGGTNLQALIDAERAGRIAGRLAVVVCNRPGAGAIERAGRADIPVVLHDHTTFPSRAAFDAAIAATLEAHGVDLVVLAGFMRILTPGFVQRFAQRIVNTHPSLLPAFPGAHAPADALEHGVKLTGVTVHLVDEGVDSGPIIAQRAVPVEADDTPERLHARIQAVEHALLPEVVDLLLRGAVRVEGRRVFVTAAPSRPLEEAR